MSLSKEEISKKVSEGMKKYYKENPERARERYSKVSKSLKKAYEEKGSYAVQGRLSESRRKEISDKKFLVWLEKALAKGFENLTQQAQSRIVKYEQENKCSCCGISSWQEKSLALQLHHIDGNRDNKKRENVTCLCPNCHSQTYNWTGKKRMFKVDKSILIAKIKEGKSDSQIIEETGLSFTTRNYRELGELRKIL